MEFVYRVKCDEVTDINCKFVGDHVSGTAGGTIISYYSPDGVNYQTTGDTITIASFTADYMDTETLDLNDFNYPYLKFIYLQTGTAVTVPKLYIYIKKN